MKRLVTLCLIAAGLIISQITAKAQSTGPGGHTNPERPWASFPNLEHIPRPAVYERPRLKREVRREPKVINKGILAPAVSDVAQHQFLLSQKNTGMMRLLPREKFDWEVYKVGKSVEMRGGGTYFSFYYRSHEYGQGSDISYEHGLLKVGFAGADYGMISDLGDTPLEPISMQHPRAHFLLDYKPPRQEKDARIEAKKFEPLRKPNGLTGFSVDGVSYLRRVDAVVNHTYLLRSIVYRKSDVLVAFRVVSVGEDGGLTIAWKILKEFKPTELILERR